MKKIDLGKISVPLDEYASQGNAILGIRDSGKSYTATAIAERLMDAGIPIITFDPIGIWRYLRVPGAGKGYEVVVAGGKQGDLPLTPRGAQEIVRAAMRENVSLVVDLYDIHLSKADWREVVASCIRTLLYENGEHGLRHIFIEEAAEFCPQVISPDQGRVYAEVEKLARMGGNALLGYTLINQRAEQVNKAVLELCDCMILHRQKGRNSINALSKWLEIASNHDSRALISSLPGLAQGECWVWPAGSDAPVRTKVPAKNSFHPDRRARQAAPKATSVVDVSAFVTTMKGSLEALTKEAEANDPKLLRAENARLRAELAKKPAAAPASTGKAGPRREDTATITALRKALEAAMKFIIEINTKDFFKTAGESVDQAQIERAIAGATEAVKKMVQGHIDQRNQEFAKLKRQGERVVEALQALLKEDVTVKVDVRSNEPFTVSPAAPAPRAPQPHHGNGSGEAFQKSERLVLTALAQYPNGRRKPQVAILTGYAVNGGAFNNALGALRTRGLITRGDPMQITEAGLRALGSYEPLPEGRALLEHWLGNLGKAERLVLQALADTYPKTMNKQQVAVAAGYEANGGAFNNALGRLRTLELIKGRGSDIKASEDFFNG